jgi:putrescine aminotransferase
MLGGFVHVPFGDVEALEAVMGEQTAAVLLEPVQGEAGIHVAPPSYLQAARTLCDKHGALLILDEVQTGLGRTGTLFASEHFGIAPDMMTLAKALGGGVMPIGATMATKAVWDKVFKENPFLHTSTFGGNEAACVAALETLTIIQEEGLAEQSKRKGERLMAGLRNAQAKYPDLLTEVRGLGLMIGVEFADSDVGKLAIGALVQSGVVAAYTLNNPKVMRFEPPLVITDEQVEFVVEAFGKAMADTKELLDELLG